MINSLTVIGRILMDTYGVEMILEILVQLKEIQKLLLLGRILQIVITQLQIGSQSLLLWQEMKILQEDTMENILQHHQSRYKSHRFLYFGVNQYRHLLQQVELMLEALQVELQEKVQLTLALKTLKYKKHLKELENLPEV